MVEGLDDEDAVRLCVMLGVPVAEGERDVEEVPLEDAVRLWVVLGDAVPEAVADDEGVEVGEPDMLIVPLGVEDTDGEALGLGLCVPDGLCV